MDQPKLQIPKIPSKDASTNGIVTERIRYRKFLIVDRLKQSQPGTIVMGIRPSENGTPPDASSPPREMRVLVEEEDSPRPTDDIPITHLPLSSGLTEQLNADPDRDEDCQSKLSFIMKEKLHMFAGDIRRRTSEVKDEMEREVTPDLASSMGGSVAPTSQHRPSLMSLIGLQRPAADVAEATESNSCLPSSIDSHSRKYLIWLSIVVSAFLYNAFCIPLRSTYPYQTESNLVYWLTADYLADAVYVLDLFVVKPRLRFMRGGIVVKERKEMVKHYLMSVAFKLDLLSIAPLDLLYIWTGPIAAWRIVRLCKLLSFWQLFNLLDNSFSNPYIIRITKTLGYMIYIIHCNSCIYYMLSAWQAFGQIAYRMNNKWYLNKWVYNNQGNAYIRCFYFTAAVATSTGNNPAPTNVIEYVYMTFSWMMGVFVFALLLGQIRDIVSNANRNREQYRQTMDTCLSECKRLQLPKEIVDRVRDWFIYTWHRQKTLDEKKLIEKLPLKLQTDLALSVHYNTLSKVQLFQGDVGKEMYIVNDGILQVVGGDHNEKVFAELTEGSVFGEISLLAIGGNNRRTANIRSKGYATLFVLSKEDLNDVIKDYPEAQQLLRRKARHVFDYAYVQMLNNDAKAKHENDKGEQKSLEERCRVSTHLSTPRMLNAVVKVLPEQSLTGRQLRTAIAGERSWALFIPPGNDSSLADRLKCGDRTVRSTFTSSPVLYLVSTQQPAEIRGVSTSSGIYKCGLTSVTARRFIFYSSWELALLKPESTVHPKNKCAYY
ncbi:Cyclic nucleotide-gated cation channel beta-1 [Toxocara canis]|uniref:Cyclic nucleotide-gated cation channel beta-1 n=1 Tax=Toxocara canis TaxID=6265 RepID=A0A0B2VXU6_TOXCA|nr:Cyclic nucleotide-gated cation channel beta-1 [Toxocara canis]